ncbi:MAG: hypothetical protein HQL81_05895 [Magnetococcales bacterium]|nr:hypothetical protein [Magnetococcales bacterium]
MVHDLSQNNILRGHTGKNGLVPGTGVGTLFDLNHLDGFQYFKTMSSFGQKQNIPRLNDPALDIDRIPGIEINPQTPRFDDQNLLGLHQIPVDGIMYMRNNETPLFMRNQGKLLGRIVRGEKMNTLTFERISDDKCIQDAIPLDSINQ